ncbi:MAG TPA: G1 family glutamic endopeptidase [Gaiellaceae bacterium]|nr:G1 family glutamic endopeptidase [Gaiellaceae bacterium]
MRLLPAGGAVLAVAATLAAAPAAFGAPRATPQQSSNWAGYAITDATTLATGQPDPAQTPPLQFSNVTGTFRLPKVTCTAASSPAYSAFWVGLGGYSATADALEQVGVDADCSRAGTPTYYAWYELVPSPAVKVALEVSGGDIITTSVVVNGTDVLVQVKDRTRRTSFTRHLQMATPDVSSAEWIAEAPSACSSLGDCRVLPLANFGTVGFTNIAATANAHAGTLTDATWAAAAITLVPRSSRRAILGQPDDASTAGAAPAGATADGRGFSVAWIADATRLSSP